MDGHEPAFSRFETGRTRHADGTTALAASFAVQR
jgi:hypothetical protein